MVKGTPKADALAISAVRVTVTASSEPWTIEADVRMIDTESGETHTHTKVGSGWPQDVVDKLKDLISSMEKAASTKLLKDVEGLSEDDNLFKQEPPGLGEHLGVGDASI
jgi:hypothetical protein